MDKLPLVEKIIVIDELPEYKEKEISWSEVFRMGKNIWHLILWKTSLLSDNPYRITTMRRLPIPQARRPTRKGVILTHRNYTANVEQALSCVDIDDTWRTLIILPLDHCFAHVVGFISSCRKEHP